jgi:DDE superfamily endonuclease
MTGAVLAPGKRTVTAMLQMMGRSAASDFQTYHRVLNRAVWSPLTASRLLLRLLEPISKEEDTSQRLFEKYQAASRLSIKRVIATYTNVSLVVGNSS